MISCDKNGVCDDVNDDHRYADKNPDSPFPTRNSKPQITKKRKNSTKKH